MSFTLKDDTVNSIERYYKFTERETEVLPENPDDPEFAYNLGAKHAFGDVLQLILADDTSKGKAKPYLFIAAGVIVGSAVVYRKREQIAESVLNAKFFVKDYTAQFTKRLRKNDEQP